MSIKPGAASQLVNLALFSGICLASHYFHGYKKLRRRWSQRIKSGSEIDDRKRLVVISGCDHGFGRIIAEKLATLPDTNMLIVALTLTKEAADALGAKFENKRLFAVQCDVTSDADVAAMRDRVEDIVKSGRVVLHTIVNNAGIADPGDFVWFKNTDAHRRVMEVNYFGQLRVTQTLLPIMLRTSCSLKEGARILSLSSVCGVSASPANSAYSASKFAVEAWCDSIRLELAPFNIAVVKIRPGQYSTQIQSEWFTGIVRNFGSAPECVRELYGGEEYSDKVQKIADGAGNNHADASAVAEPFLDIILMDGHKLEPYYWLGSDAHTFWRALHSIPTVVADTVKMALLHLRPIQRKLPPNDVVSHVTIRVQDLDKSLAFYTALGFIPFGKAVEGQLFIAQGQPKNQKQWSTLILLKEDRNLPTRGMCNQLGMVRLAMHCGNVDQKVKQLRADFGMEPMAPPVFADDKSMKIAAYASPDGMTHYFIEFVGLGGYLARALLVSNQTEPNMLHWSVNVVDYKKGLEVFDKTLGFKVVIDQTWKDLAKHKDVFSAWGFDIDSIKIPLARLCKLKEDTLMMCVMEWEEPKAVSTGEELLNSISIAVTDVENALQRAQAAGMIVEEKPKYRILPVFGQVHVGTAYVESGCNPVEFCCFDNKFYSV